MPITNSLTLSLSLFHITHTHTHKTLNIPTLDAMPSAASSGWNQKRKRNTNTSSDEFIFANELLRHGARVLTAPVSTADRVDGQSSCSTENALSNVKWVSCWEYGAVVGREESWADVLRVLVKLKTRVTTALSITNELLQSIADNWMITNQILIDSLLKIWCVESWFNDVFKINEFEIGLWWKVLKITSLIFSQIEKYRKEII